MNIKHLRVRDWLQWRKFKQLSQLLRETQKISINLIRGIIAQACVFSLVLFFCFLRFQSLWFIKCSNIVFVEGQLFSYLRFSAYNLLRTRCMLNSSSSLSSSFVPWIFCNFTDIFTRLFSTVIMNNNITISLNQNCRWITFLGSEIIIIIIWLRW